ncbi:nischarin-like [Daphnia carinata]|uniref:nischarin-like n=1 Tax=Daphnia carinata TaxID=120202 RepID=UPI00258085EA|nr:nischarin-like [Daphnia carinata]
MALYVYSKSRVDVCIPFAEKEEDCTVYVIKVTVGEVWWLVKQRYKNFDSLHQQLVLNHGIRKDLLPAKKILGNKDPEFIERRRADLEIYLKKIVQFLEKALPLEVCSFFEFEEYEVYSLVRKMASELYINGETKILSGKTISMNPLQLHAVTQKIQLPRSPVEQLNREQDFAHVLDFLANIESLEIVGNRDFYRNSNLILNSLPYDLSAFKSLKHLCFNGANVSSLMCARSLRNNLETLSAHSCGLKTVIEVLVCDSVHKNLEVKIDSPYVWRELISLDLSENNLTEVSPAAVCLVPKLRRLWLNCNALETVANLSSLSALEALNLSNNRIRQVPNLHTKLGNVKSLFLAQNRLSSLDGLGKLYGLVTLDVRSNKIADLETIRPVAALPCLEELTLTGNPVTTVLDFRTKVLTMFGTRAGEINLDNEKAMQKELDTVAVLLALSNSAKKMVLK